MDQAMARGLAIRYLDDAFPEQAGQWDIADDQTVETADGWLFEWNSAEYIRTRDEELLLFGAVPLWVSRTGSIELRSPDSDPG